MSRRSSILVALAMMGGCSAEESASPGAETGDCRREPGADEEQEEQAPCDEGLWCLSEVCVDPSTVGSDTEAAESDGGSQSAGETTAGSTSDSDPMDPTPDPTSDTADDPPGTAGDPTDTAGDPTDTAGDPTDTGSQDDCPFSTASINCESACAGDVAWNENCDSGPSQSLEDCIFGCEYSKNLGPLSSIELEWFGCMQQTGGGCDAVTDCLWEVTCYD